ncbi:MAG: signal peptidase II [Lentisphaeria bacterium]|nr:signal peptidase II [Lentisphaeria bacterium]
MTEREEKKQVIVTKAWKLWSAGLVVVLLDQLTKIAVDKAYPENWSRDVIPGFFNLVHVRNYGAAWGMFAGRTWLLGVVSLVALILLILYFKKLSECKPFNEWVLSIIGGGIAGNMLDRFIRGSVIDFLDFHWREVYHYPSFNVADIAISVGVTILVIYTVFDEWRAKRKAAAKE